MLQIIEVVCSKDKIVFDEIKYIADYNSPGPHLKIFHLDSNESVKQFLQSFKKISTLIISDLLGSIEEIVAIADNVINFEVEKNFCNEMKMHKPFKLSSLISHMELLRAQYQKKLFVVVNNEILFSETGLVMKNNGNITKFTEKEFSIVKNLIMADNFSMEKNQLLNLVWQFEAELETHTLESHISKLRAKLPENFLNFTGNSYILDIKSIY